jgi:magnesium chelatase family protein
MQIQRYLSRISGPLLDRVDMHIELMPIKYEDIGRPTAAEPSSSIKKRVSQARLIQHRRYHRYGFSLNSQLPHKLLADTCAVSAEAADLLKQAMSEFFMSARAYDKILRVARTIADLDDKPSIGVEDISEAIGYRCLDAKIWCM